MHLKFTETQLLIHCQTQIETTSELMKISSFSCHEHQQSIRYVYIHDLFLPSIFGVHSFQNRQLKLKIRAGYGEKNHRISMKGYLCRTIQTRAKSGVVTVLVLQKFVAIFRFG